MFFSIKRRYIQIKNKRREMEYHASYFYGFYCLFNQFLITF